MIKLIFCARRCAHLTRAEFQDYWLNHHGPLFMKHAQTYQALRYVQSHTLATPLNENIRLARGTDEEYDGVGEIWWASEEAFLSVVNSPQGEQLRKIFLEDEARFVDPVRSAVFFTREHVLLG